MVAGCGVPVRRNWGLKGPECHGTLSSNTQPRLWPLSPQLYITGPADRLQMGRRSCALPPLGIKASFPQTIVRLSDFHYISTDNKIKNLSVPVLQVDVPSAGNTRSLLRSKAEKG